MFGVILFRRCRSAARSFLSIHPRYIATTTCVSPPSSRGSILLSTFRWSGADAEVDSSYTPPSNWYTDARFLHEVEMKHTFRGWVYAGRMEQLEGPGSYLAGSVAGEPYVIVKTSDQRVHASIHNGTQNTADDLGGVINSTSAAVSESSSSSSSITIPSSSSPYKAFYNVCRHHAAQICDEGSGQLENHRFVCPYHGWQYTLDGRLAKATSMKGCKNFRPKDNGLLPIAVDTVGPWLYVHLGDSTNVAASKTASSQRTQSASTSSAKTSISVRPGTDVDVHVGSEVSPAISDTFSLLTHAFTANAGRTLHRDQPDIVTHFHRMLQETGYENLVHVRSKSYKLQCNWKVFVDNYLDGGYHVPYAHPGLTSLLDMKTYVRDGTHKHFFIQSAENSTVPVQVSEDKNSGTRLVSNRVVGKSANNTGIDTDTGKGGERAAVTKAAEGRPAAALYLFHYPNLMVNRYGDWMDTNVVWPTGPDSCVVNFDWYVTKELAEDKAYIEMCLVDSEKVQEEDIALCARVQTGLRSSAYGLGGRYAPSMESGEFMFHKLLQRDLEAAAKRLDQEGTRH